MKSTKKLFWLLLIAPMLLAACSQPVATNTNKETPQNQEGGIHVITTFPPLYSFVTNVVGDNGMVTNLVDPGASVHIWEPKASSLKALSDADLLVMNGLELEPFIEDMISAANNPNLKTLVTSKSVEDAWLNTPELFEPGEEHHDEHDDEEEDHEDEHDHEHGGTDPHLWLSPSLAIRQVEAIRDTIAQIDPENAQAYQENAAAYIEKLQNLDQETRSSLNEATSKNFIVFHDAYTYYMNDYGLMQYRKAAVEPFPGKEPTAAYFGDLLHLISEEEIDIIFTEPQFNPLLVQNLQQETGINGFEIDPIGLELSAEGYESNIRQITQAFLNAFK